MSAQWYTPADIAGMFGVSRDTVYRWCEQHIVPAVKVGSVWRIHRQSFDAYHEALADTARRDARCLETVERGPSTNERTSDGSPRSSLTIVPPSPCTDEPKPLPSPRGRKSSQRRAIGAWGSGGENQ